MKRFLALMLACLMLAPLFVACGPSDNTPDTPSDDPAGDTPSDTPSDEPTGDTPSGDTPSDPPSDEPTDPDFPTGEPATAKEQENITDFLRLHGRTFVQSNELKLFWTYSGFSVNIVGTGLTAELTTTNTDPNFIGSLCVYVDGAMQPANTVVVTKNGSYTLVEGLTNGEHTIEVRKKNEAIYGGSATLGFKSLSVTDGEFVRNAPEAKELKIAFVGDSITSGFGNMVTDGSGEKFTTPTQDGTMTYATLTARALGADIEVISRSGIAFVQNTDRPSFYEHYEKTASLPSNPACTDAWDFDANGADIIVINLGTNDSGAKYNGTGVTDAYMIAQAVEFIELVRENNPYALIVWTYGLMGDGRRAALEAAVKQVNDAGDHDVYYLPLTPQNTGKNGVGVHGHPTVQTHILAAEQLAPEIADLIGAGVDRAVFTEAQLMCNEAYRLASADAYTAESYAVYAAAAEAAEEAVRTGKGCGAALTDLREAYAGLKKKEIIRPEDMSSEYIIIDTCDEKGSWTFTGTVSSGMDTKDQIAGAGCFTSTGGNAKYAVNFMHTGEPYNIAMPADYADWYLELWIYVDDPANMSSSGDIEISEVMDNKEFTFFMPRLDLQAGWNHVQLPLKTAAGNASSMQAIKNVRIFWVNLTNTLTFKVDDIVLSRGLYAADRAELDTLIAKAEAVASPSAELTEALTFAKGANSQRYVDIATERLEAAMK